MKLHELASINDRPKKRVGRGKSSGKGKTSGRGMKGQHARSKVRPGFEGGQMPLTRRLPHLRGRGLNAHASLYEVVNLRQLETRYAAGELVTVASLKEKNLVSGKAKQVKILGSGNLTKKLHFRGKFLFSQKTTDKISALKKAKK